MLGFYLQRQHLHIFHGNRFAVEVNGVDMFWGAIAGHNVTKLCAVGKLEGIAMAGKI